jgi:hypothetical protein
MSAVEYLLTTHVRVEHLKEIAVKAGVDASEIISYQRRDRSPVWAEAYVRKVGVPAAIDAACANLAWGRRALYDFPLARDVSLDEVLERIQHVESARGDVLVGQAETGLSTLPRVAIARRLSDGLALIVTDVGTEHPLPQQAIGPDRHVIPEWSLCALARHATGWRLEVYADRNDALTIWGVLVGRLELRPLFGDPPNVTLNRYQVEKLADRLQAPLKSRSVYTHQEQTGLRKMSAEVGGAFEDIRNAPFWPTIDGVADEADMDMMEVPWQGHPYTLQVSRHGSFWFRSYSPRGLIDAVLGQAEEICRI